MIHVEDHAAHCLMARGIIISLSERTSQVGAFAETLLSRGAVRIAPCEGSRYKGKTEHEGPQLPAHAIFSHYALTAVRGRHPL